MPDVNLGTARGRIEIDASNLGVATAQLKFLGDRLLLLGGAAIAGFGFAVKAAMDFEEQISRFKAVSDASGKQMDVLREKALKLGQDSAFGATQVMEGFVELAKAGMTTKDVMMGVGDAMIYLAAAGEMPVALAADAIVSTLRQFDLPATDAVRVTNLLAGAANAALGDVEDLVNALRYAGPVAHLAGISIEDTATILAIFQNGGIKASQAGTTLRGVLLGLAANTPKAANTLQELGIITEDGANAFFNMNGEMKPLPEVFQILHDALLPLNRQQRINALNSIFQRRALSGAALAAMEAKGGFEGMRGEIEKTTAQEVMDTKLKNLRGSLRKLKASIETLLITIGEPFQKPLRDIADFLKKIANKIEGLPDKVKTLGAEATLATGGLLLFAGGLLKVVEMTIRFNKAVRTVGSAMGILQASADGAGLALNPVVWVVLLVILVLLLLVGTAYLVKRNWDKIWNAMKDNPAIAAIITYLALILFPLFAIWGALGILWAKWKELWPKIKAVAKDVWDWLVVAFEDLKQGFEKVKKAVTDAWNKLKDIAGDVKRKWEETLNWFKTDFMDFFEHKLPDFMKRLPGILAAAAAEGAKALARAFIQELNQLPYQVGFVLGLVVGAIIRFLLEAPILIVQGAAELVRLFGEGLQKLLPIVIQLMVDVGLAILNGIIYIVLNVPIWLLELLAKVDEWVGKMIDLFIKLVRLAVEEIVKLIPKLVEWGADLGGKMVDIGVDLVTKAGEWAVKITPKIMDALIDLPGKLLSKGMEAIDGFLAGLGVNFEGGVLPWLAGLPGRMLSALDGLISSFFGLGMNVLIGLWDGLKAIKDQIIEWIKNLGSDIVKAAKKILDIFSPSKAMMEVGKQTMQGLLVGMQKVSPKVMAEVQHTAAGIAGTPFGAPNGAGAGGLSIGTVRIEVVGVSDPAQAHAAGKAAAEGFSSALERKQLATTARMV
jgi:TP901 family phage tail tape measure protein